MGVLYLGSLLPLGIGGWEEWGHGGYYYGEDDIVEEGGLLIEVVLGGVLIQGAPQGVIYGREIL
jgi:hypothetical protein